jgi:demethylmacrocin O-methyltransferase
MKTLSEISQLYPTDKDFTHNYYNLVYENALNPIKNKVKLLCEIGVGGIFDWGDKKIRPANSLKVWRDYFTNANILGLDIVKYPEISDMDRISIDWLDQSKKDLIIEYSNKLNNYDIIIDDGSHNVYDQQITLAYFFKSLKSGGIYILEDLHSSIEVNIPEKTQIWGWGEPGFITPLQILEQFQKTNTIITDYLTKEEEEYLQQNIASVEIFHLAPTSITSIIVKK